MSEEKGEEEEEAEGKPPRGSLNHPMSLQGIPISRNCRKKKMRKKERNTFAGGGRRRRRNRRRGVGRRLRGLSVRSLHPNRRRGRTKQLILLLLLFLLLSLLLFLLLLSLIIISRVEFASNPLSLGLRSASGEGRSVIGRRS